MKLPSRFFATITLASLLYMPGAALPQAPVNSPDTGAQPAASSAPATAAPLAEKPHAAAVEAPVVGTGKPYVIGPLDVLDINVWNDSKLSRPVAVRPDGLISIPLIGEIKADGLTPAELTQAITARLTTLMNDPEVSVTIAKINSKKYAIFGEVNRPGEYPLIGQTTVLDAFANCGGFKDFARPNKIYVLRGTERLRFNFNEVKQGKKMEQNIILQNGDRIFVP